MVIEVTVPPVLILVKFTGTGKQPDVTSGATNGMIGFGVETVIQAVSGIDPQASVNTTQDCVVFAGVTLNGLPVPSIVLPSYQVNVYGELPPAPVAVKAVVAPGQIVISGEIVGIESCGGCVMVNVSWSAQPLLPVTSKM